MTENTSALKSDLNEINLIQVAKSVWFHRNIVFISLLLSGIIGLVVALNAPKEFIATTIMVPSGGSGNSGINSLGGLAAMAGINLNSAAGGELSPNVYPKIIASLPFQLELMKTPLNFKERKEPISFYGYYSIPQKENLLVKYTIGLPGVIMGLPKAFISLFKGNEPEKSDITELKNPIVLTAQQQSVLRLISDCISLEVNLREGTITLQSRMSEALVAAQLGQRAQELLQRFIIEFKIKKAKANLDFIQQRYDETKQKYEEIQQKLASFNDRNKNVSLATVKTEEVRLTNQYNLVFSIYSELARQLEQAKIQVKQDTPVFTIIEPVSVPTKRSKPNRPKILLVWLFLGGVLGVGFVIGKEYIEPLKKRWFEKVDL